MWSRIQRYFVGDLNSKKLKAKIKNSSDLIVEESFGILGGNVYFIKPGPGIDIAGLLNTLDTQPEGRKANGAFRFFSGGDVILARSDQEALAHHKLFLQSLTRPVDYIQFTLTALQTYLAEKNEFNLKELAADPIRAALAKGMFDVEGLTPAFAQTLQAFSQLGEEVNNDFASSIWVTLAASYYSWLLYMSSAFRAARYNYLTSAKEFIDSQAEKIIVDLKQYADDKNKRPANILSLSVLQLIKDQNPALNADSNALSDFLRNLDSSHIQPYIGNSYIRTVPATILAGENIMPLLACGLTALSKDKNLLLELRDEISRLELLVGNSREIQRKIDGDRQEGGLLHRFYLECIRRESLLKSTDDLSFETLSLRYTSDGIDINGKHITPKSMIIILNAMPLFDEKKWKNPSQFNPDRFLDENGKFDQAFSKSMHKIFSEGSRLCPANKITEYLFKTFIPYIVANYDLVLKRKDNQKNLEAIKDPEKIRVCLVPPTESVSKKYILRKKRNSLDN